MSSRILVDGTKAMAKMYLEYVDAVMVVREKGDRLLDALNSMSGGSDWTAVATELGLPAPGSGAPPSTHAQDAWTIVSNAQAKLKDAAVSELSRLDQG